MTRKKTTVSWRTYIDVKKTLEEEAQKRGVTLSAYLNELLLGDSLNSDERTKLLDNDLDRMASVFSDVVDERLKAFFNAGESVNGVMSKDNVKKKTSFDKDKKPVDDFIIYMNGEEVVDYAAFDKAMGAHTFDDGVIIQGVRHVLVRNWDFDRYGGMGPSDMVGCLEDNIMASEKLIKRLKKS